MLCNSNHINENLIWDSKNKERIVNIVKGIIENDKIKPFIREYAEKSYEKIMSVDVLSVSERSEKEEEEK